MGSVKACRWRRYCFYPPCTRLGDNDQGRIKGGGHFGQVPRFRGAPRADFLGLVVVYGPMFFGTALHNFGRTYHICSGALGHRVLISNMNRGPFCAISCKRWLRMRKIAFQGSRFQNFPRENPPDSPCALGASANRISDFQFINN